MGEKSNKVNQALERRRFMLFAALLLCISVIAGTAINAFAQSDEVGLQSEASRSVEQKVSMTQLEEVAYIVTFQDHDGAELAVYEVKAGQTSPVPAPPSRQNYAFVGWDTELTNVQSDLTVKAQYRELKKYTITIQYQFADGRVAAQSYTAEVKEGYNLSEEVTSPQVEGYMPDQTSVTLNIASVQENRVFTVVYTKQSGTAYTVKHHLETLMLDEYELADTDTLYGETAQNVNATPKDYSGFDLVMPLASGTIAADGSLELNVYYQRETVTLSFESSGGTYVEPLTGRYGETLTLPADPERPGHTFDGWIPEVPATFPSEDASFAAQWIVNTEADYIMIYWVENANDDEYSMVGLEVKNTTVGAAPDLPDPLNPFPDNIPFPNTSERDKKEYFYEYNEAKTTEENSGVVIDAEKSVFVNVYFDRKEFTVHFVYSGHPSWFSPDNVLNSSLFTPLVRKYQIEMSGTTRISEDYGTNYDFSTGQNTLTPETERTVSVTAKYMADIGADVPRVRYLGVAGTDPEQPAMIATFYASSSRTWSHHMTTSDPTTHQTSVMTAYYFVDSWGRYQGEESRVNFYLINTVLTPSYQYIPMFEPIGGGKEDQSDYIAAEPITVTFFNYSSDKSVTTRYFAGFKAPVPDRFFNPWFGGIENAEHQWPDDAKAYYERERYTLGFYDGTTVLKEYAGDEAIWYEKKLADYYFEPETPADKPGYTFAGWYTDQILQDETTLLDFDRAIMPAQGLMLYAKWNPPSYEVTFDLNGGAGDTPVSQNIAVGGYVNPPTEPSREGYSFGGWIERNRTVVYNMSHHVSRHLDLVARWIPNLSGTYTVYYLELGTNQPLADSKTLHNLLVASSHTETAELIDSYLPDALSKSISVNASAQYNSIVFYYKAFNEVNYTVRYETTDGQTLRTPETKTTRYNYVTENFMNITGYRAMEEQITLPLSFNEVYNAIVFTYLPPDNVQYTVRHYMQGLDRTGYFLADTEVFSGLVGSRVMARPKSYTGFDYKADFSGTTGVITSDGGLVLNLYYNRQALTISFEASEGGSLSGVTSYTGILWGTPFGQATRIPTPQPQAGYTFVGWSPRFPADNQVVTQNAIYTALFEQNEVVDPGIFDPETPVTTPDSESSAPVVIPISVAAEPDQEEVFETETIQADAIPLFGSGGHWALLNLILALIGVVVGFAVTLARFVTRKKDEADEARLKDSYVKAQGRRRVLATLSLVVGVVSLVVFFLTEDMSLLMAIMDQWTMLMIVLTVIEVLLVVLSFKKKTHKETIVHAA